MAPLTEGPSQSRLLQLPGELRNQILRHVITQPEPLNLCNPRAPFHINIGIMHVCRQLRDEARYFLYHDNTLEVEVDSLGGTVTSLHFSRLYSMSEYRPGIIVEDISTVFLQRFSRFQFRLADTRKPESLRRALCPIKHHFQGKHITIVLPPVKEQPSRLLPPPGVTTATTTAVPRAPSMYPRISNPLLCFTLIRCTSLSISPSSSRANSCDELSQQQQQRQHKTLIELVTSDRPVIDMTRDYEDAQRSARNVVRMIVPDGHGQEYTRLAADVFDSLAAMCECANAADQDGFVREQAEFQRCYRLVEALQWVI